MKDKIHLCWYHVCFDAPKPLYPRQMVSPCPSVLLLWNADWNRLNDSTGRDGYCAARTTSFAVQLNKFYVRKKPDGFVWGTLFNVRHSLDSRKMSQGCITSAEEIQSWWEVPAIAHFCSLFRTAFNLPDFEIEVNDQSWMDLTPSFPFRQTHWNETKQTQLLSQQWLSDNRSVS